MTDTDIISKETLSIDLENFSFDQEYFDSISEGIKKLSIASQDQFEELKKEKWFNRLFDIVTFSQKKNIRVAEQISNVSQALDILFQILIKLSNYYPDISRVINESKNDIKRLSEQNIELKTRIVQLEYQFSGLKSEDLDIGKLSEDNKQVLISCLYNVNNKNRRSSENQRIYANTVCEYLGIKDHNKAVTNYQTSIIDNIDDLSKRRILNCCLEFIFLKRCSALSFYRYRKFVNEFDIGKKKIKKIKQAIKTVYKMYGESVFIEKYQNSIFEYNDNNEFEIDFFSLEPEETESPIIEKSEEVVSDMLYIREGETKIYSNKKLYLRARIVCDGIIEFNDCELYYNENNIDNCITLNYDAKLSIKNQTKVYCKGYNLKSLIECNGNNVVGFDSAEFYDCSYFLSSNNSIAFSMTNCKLKNCFDQFININIGKNDCEIANNEICQDDLSYIYINNINNSYYSHHILIYIRSYGKRVNFHTNTITEEKSYWFLDDSEEKKLKFLDLCYLSCDNAEVIESTFKGITTAIEAPIIKNCGFINCKAAIKTIYTDYYPLVDNCYFENCTKIILAAENTQIINVCKFYDCYDELISPCNAKGGIIVKDCEFKNIKNNNVNNINSITFWRRNDKKTEASKISNCTFENITLGNSNYLIAPEGFEKPYNEKTADIINCTFRNCSTTNASKKIIKEYLSYFKTKRISDMRTKECKAIYIRYDCTGLDQIKTE